MNLKFSLIGFGINSIPFNVGQTPGQPVTIDSLLQAVKEGSVYPFLYNVVESPFRRNVNLVFSFSYKGWSLASQLSNIVGSEERVWQFYVLDENGKSIPNVNRIPFDKYELHEGYTVIWRLVTVIKQPIEIVKRVRNGTEKEQGDSRHHTTKLK